MNVYSIFTQICNITLHTFIKLYLKILLIDLLYYQIMNVILLDGINKITIKVTFKLMNFLMIRIYYK